MRKILWIRFLVAPLAAWSFFWFGGEAAAQKLLADGTKDLSEQIAASITKEQKHRVAVLPFRELSGQSTLLDSYLAEELITHLVQAGQVDIVERTMLDKVLGELKLDQSGLIDAEGAKKVGRLLGADAILTGSITDLTTFVAVNCRIIDTQTGRVVGAAQVKIAKDSDVIKILGVQISTGTPSDPRSPRVPDTGSQKPKPAKLLQEIQGFLFELRNCKARGTTVDCDFLITSQESDKRLEFRPLQSRLIDETGTEIMGEEGSLGAITESKTSNWGVSMGLRSNLVAGVPTKARLKFSGISQDSARAALIELWCGDLKAQFRNVPLSRE